jgi:hypothetical protein
VPLDVMVKARAIASRSPFPSPRIVNAPFSVLASKTRMAARRVRESARLGSVAGFTNPLAQGRRCRAASLGVLTVLGGGIRL